MVLLYTTTRDVTVTAAAQVTDNTNPVRAHTWQDSRNGNVITNAEDAYFASLKLNGSGAADEGSPAAPRWVLLGSGLLMGLGVAMSLVWLTTRRRTSG